MMSFLTTRSKTAERERTPAGGPSQQELQARFNRYVLPHVPAAYNLARWLVNNGDDAEDQVQEACLRAFRHMDRFHGIDGRAWFLTIVRNTCYTFLHRRGIVAGSLELEAEVHAPSEACPEESLMRKWDARSLQTAIEALPAPLREVIVLREFEELSYKEIAEVAEVPVGTVMSRLARARARLRTVIENGEEGGNGLS